MKETEKLSAYLHVQLIPFPVKLFLQTHWKLPSVLLQVASE